MLGRVLIIEDEVVLAKWLARLLGKSFEVVLAHSGQDGIDTWIEQGPFDVVLCDLMLPVVTGMQIHKKLHSLSPGSEHRIVFMTGGAFTAAIEHFLENITNPRLEKPFDVPTLLATVERVAQSSPRVTTLAVRSRVVLAWGGRHDEEELLLPLMALQSTHTLCT